MKTKMLNSLNQFERRKRLKKEGDTGIDVLTKQMKKMAGLDVRYTRDFSGGCSGLKKVKRRR